MEPRLVTYMEVRTLVCEDAIISYGRLIDKSVFERHKNPLSSISPSKNQREFTLTISENSLTNSHSIFMPIYRQLQLKIHPKN